MEISKHIEVKAADKTVAFLAPSSDGLKDVYIDTRLNGESTLEFSLPSDNEKNNELTAECEIHAGGRVYNLLIEDSCDDTMDESGRLWSKYISIERFNELDTKYPEPYITNDPNISIPADLAVIIVGGGTDLSGGKYIVGTAAHALYAVLQGSDWRMGVCDVTGMHDLEAEKISRLQLIKMVQDIWGGYIVWDSLNKIVHLRDGKQWQNYTGFQVRYAKNMKNITRTQSNKLVTKLYCFGKDDLDIASVNDGKKYVTDFSYTTKEYASIYSNPDIESPEELKQKAIAELALKCKPKYNYQIKMVDLRTLPDYSHEDFTLGDMVDVINPKMDIEANVRLIRHKYNVFQPWKCELELGDVNERFIEKLKASFNISGFVDNTFNSMGEMSGKKLVDGTVIGNAIADAALEASKFNTKQLILTGDIWMDNTPSGGYVTWNSHKLFYDGKEYTIVGGSTNKKYIVWRKDMSPTLYQAYAQAEFDGLTLKDYDWVIAVNNSGIHDIAWYNRLARQFIASAFIANAAIKTAHIEDAAIVDAKIANLSANKIVAGIINTVGAIYLGDTSFALVAKDKQLIVKDTQTIPKTRVVLGYNEFEGDYGIWVYSASGKEILGASGLGVNVVGTNQLINGSVTDLKVDSVSADKITAGTIEALIEILSPIIRSGVYYGKGNNAASMIIGNETNLADLSLYRGGNWGFPIFRIVDDYGKVFFEVEEQRLLSSNGFNTDAYGNWDFSQANTTGIVARFAPEIVKQ